MRELLDAPATWTEVERALSATVGSGSHGARHLDGQAVPFVDMGNSFFRSAKHLFVLGMNSGEFPSTTVSSSFLPERLRQVVYERAGSGEVAHEHLDGRSVSYSRALDFYEATLGVAESGAEITLVHTHRDREGRQIGWSPFLDRGSIDRRTNGDSPTVERIPAGDPLRLSGAQNRSSRTLEELLESRSMRECVRILIDQATAERAGSARTLTSQEIETVLERLGDELHTAELDGVLE
jgi:hypothetical protein